MYFIYLSNILQIYTMVRFLHGTYVSYCFIKWVLVYFYSGFLWILSYIHKPMKQINDKYYNIVKIENDFLLIT